MNRKITYYALLLSLVAVLSVTPAFAQPLTLVQTAVDVNAVAGTGNDYVSSTYVPNNAILYGAPTLYKDWGSVIKQMMVTNTTSPNYPYSCMNETPSGIQVSQNGPYVDDNSSADFINRTYTSNQDFTTHCDITLAQHKSFQANNVFMVDRYIHHINNTAFLSQKPLKVQSDLHQKLMFVNDLVYHNQFSAAINQLHEIQSDVLGKTSDGQYALDIESQTQVNSMIKNAISSISFDGITGSQLPATTTYTTPEYGPLAALVLAFAIISILVISAKNNLGFTKF